MLYRLKIATQKQPETISNDMNIQSKFAVYFITRRLYSSTLLSLVWSTLFDEVASLQIYRF